MAVAPSQDMLRRHQSTRGQTGTEYLLVVSAVVLAIVAAGYGFVPEFRNGVNRVGSDVEQMLSTGQISRRGASVPGNPLAPNRNYRLPAGSPNSGCASGTACRPLPTGPELGTPMNVCRPGDNC